MTNETLQHDEMSLEVKVGVYRVNLRTGNVYHNTLIADYFQKPARAR